jgi:AraC-like DNA-binding protein
MSNQFDFSRLSESFQSIITNPELTFKFFDMLPTPIEIWDAGGTTIYINQAGMEMVNIKDTSLLIGKYNLWKDPVCLEIMGKEVIDRIFRGETVTFPNFPAPIQDVLDRGVIEEKPWESATMDLYFLPIWDDVKFVCTICFFTVKSMYQGRADIVDAKKYIDEHWLDKFSDDAVAKAVHISLRHLSALFKQNTGMTMGDYYKKVKVDHIKEKLKDKSLTVAQAFSFCGEDSRGTYARIFKEITGMTPTEYRDSLK